MKLWTLRIRHRHGADITIHVSEDAAKAALHEYVILNWEGDGWLTQKGPLTEDREGAIEQYFSYADDEGADVEECEVDGVVPAETNHVG